MRRLSIVILSVFMLVGVAEAKTVKLGALFASSGPAAYLGLPEKQTLEMLVEEVNANGGLNGDTIDLVVYDTQGDEARTINFFKRLVTKDKVIAVIGPTRTGSTLALVPLAEQYEIPLISCAASARIVTPTRQYVFKTPQSDNHAAEKIFEYMKTKGQTKAALMTAQSGFGSTGRDALMDVAKEMGMTIVADEKFRDTDNDMTSQLTKIKNAGADAMIVWGVGPAPAIVARNARQVGLDAEVFMSHGVASKKFIDLAGSFANGIKLPAGRLIVADDLPEGDRFKPLLVDYKNEFEETFDAPVSTFGGHAYDAFLMFRHGYEKAGADKLGIVKAIETMTGVIGTAGEYNLSPTDHNGLSKDAFIMVEIKDEAFTIAK